MDDTSQGKDKASKDQPITEADIAGRFKMAFDQRKREHDNEKLPYRHISRWYLVDSRDTKKKRLPLPPDVYFKDTHVLFGWLQPSLKSHEKPHEFKLPLSKSIYWTVDRSKDTRGIWISSEEAHYRLLDPCEENGQDGKSQADVHLPIRAQCGLVWNMLDLFPTEEDLWTTHHSDLVAMSPRQVYENLACLDDKEYQRAKLTTSKHISQIPFDLDLLERCSEFCHRNLRDYHQKLEDKKCTFMSEMKKMKSLKKNLKQFTAKQYLKSAKEAEARSQQEPWGTQLIEAKETNALWRLGIERPGTMDNDRSGEVDTGQEKSMISKGESMTEKRKVPNENMSQPAKRSRASVEDQEELTRSMYYSRKRMKEALNGKLGKLLDLKSSLGDMDGSLKAIEEQCSFTSKENFAEAVKLVDCSETDTSSWEWKLLFISAVTKSKSEKEIVLKMLFKKEHGRVVQPLFIEWKEAALSQLTKWREQNPSEQNADNVASAAMLVQLLKLASRLFNSLFQGDAGKKGLEKLKERYDVDLPDFANKSLEFGSKNKFHAVANEAEIAISNLKPQESAPEPAPSKRSHSSDKPSNAEQSEMSVVSTKTTASKKTTTSQTTKRGSKTRMDVMLKKAKLSNLVATLSRDVGKECAAAENQNETRQMKSPETSTGWLSTEWWPLPPVEEDIWHKKAPTNPDDWSFPDPGEKKKPSSETGPVPVAHHHRNVGNRPSDASSRGRGMGRGRDRTLPSWMTK